MTDDGGVRLWAARAGVAERGVQARHLRRLWALPSTLLGVPRWPAGIGARLDVHWNYWWQAHLLDCLVDAQQRSPEDERARNASRLVRGMYLRNGRRWTNDYYDDVAWFGLALLRASRHLGVRRPDTLAEIAQQLRDGWTDHADGGIWWRRNDDFKNVPANGPAAILFTRLAVHGDRIDLQRARSIVDWMECYLVDHESGLVWDGLHVGQDGTVGEIERTVYTYCQGVFIGACVELARASGSPLWAQRAGRTITAVAANLTVDSPDGPVLRGAGGGDGGLFAGILARYLAQAALWLPSLGPGTVARPAGRHHRFEQPRDVSGSARVAAELVYSSGEAAWRNRAVATGGPLFGVDWSKSTVVPGKDRAPERDLSVQLSGWMLLEAAALLERSGISQR